ncbi:sodium:calcium antiporter [Candidatus Micrarchaeota archaeon]|nr:sodium:calcium antiporter [Candidatus Micrarchaeota archaeon]
MIIVLITLLFSIAVLSKSSEVLIDSAVKLSRFFKINQLAIGFLLVAVATSLPELSVSITSSMIGEGGISAGNVFGSNIANILVILGVGAFFYGIKISPSNLKDIALIVLLTTVISVYIVFNSSVQSKALNFIEGAILLLIFCIYVWDILRKKKLDDGRPKFNITKEVALRAFLFFGASILLVIISSAFVVDAAVEIAISLGIAQSFIGATIIALGTSLPELSVALQALRKKHYGLVLGNVIGSNMTNLTLVLGAASVINPINVQLPVFIAALLFAVVANSLLFYIAAIHKKIERFGGLFFLFIYLLYLVVIFGLQVTTI